MKSIRRIVVSLSIALFVVCCGAVLLFNWSVTGWKALTVPTGSMRPTIPSGSLVLMHRVPYSSLRVGDVITYANPQEPRSTITHKIIKTYKIDGRLQAFITKGDANSMPDQPVVAGTVKGKAVWHVPYVGTWLNWTKKPVGLLALVYIPALLLMFEEVARLNDYYRQSKPYLAAQKLVRKTKERQRRKLHPAPAVISVALVLAPILIAFPVQALFRSNTVALVHNSLSVASINQQCTGNGTNINVSGGGGGNNNVVVNNNTNQNASSGNASSTNGGTATSGNASNSNCTNINIHITNH